MTMTAFLTQLTEGFNVILTCVSSATTIIVGDPFLLFTVIFLFAGGVIGILGRLLSRR